ncbi:hypothetical protein B4Q13_19530, partial [Lacticaseibacillus rhamnosus]
MPIGKRASYARAVIAPTVRGLREARQGRAVGVVDGGDLVVGRVVGRGDGEDDPADREGEDRAEDREAEHDVQKGRHPERPMVLLAQQSRFDPTRAPAGEHNAWAYCHVPNGSSTDMTARIEAQVERFAPGFRDRIVARHVMGPAAIERARGWVAAMRSSDGAWAAFDRDNVRQVVYALPFADFGAMLDPP